MKKQQPFKTEADLCAAFIEWVKPQGWTAYAETAGWDILLVAADGRQCGVQAKLRLNFEVIAQALRYEGVYAREPDHRAILVPDDRGYGDIVYRLGLGLFWWSTRSWASDGNRFVFAGRGWDELLDWNPPQRCELPDFVPDVTAGASSPVQLTPWKVGALRVLAELELHGEIKRDTFTRNGINPSRWYTACWVVQGSARGLWVRGAECPPFDRQHPDVYARVLAEARARAAA